MDTITLVGPDGLTLTVPGSFTEVPEEETPQLPLVADLDERDDSTGVRPRISVRVDQLGPELNSIAQLSASTVNRQIESGRHVVAVDVLPVDGHPDGRWVTSVFPRSGTTILEYQYLTIRASQAITLSTQVKASRVDPGIALLHYLTQTLVCPDSPGTVQRPPSLSASAVSRTDPATLGPDREPLGDFSARQPFTSACPPLTPDDLAALKSIISRRRRGHDGLVAGGLVELDGRVTGAGGIARDLLLSARARLTAGLTEVGGDGRRVFQVLATGSDVAVLADPPPGQGRHGQSLEVVPSLTVAARLIRWLGLAPAWTRGIGQADALTVQVDSRAWNTRIHEPDAPVPEGAPPGLRALWSEPWQLVTVRSTKRFKNGPRTIQFLKTPEAGYAVFSVDPTSGSAFLQARPSVELLRELLVVSGAVDA
jgi:hypothetical protein